MVLERKLRVFYEKPKNGKIERFGKIIKRNEIISGMKERNLKVYRKLDKNLGENEIRLELVGYDGKIKLISNRISIAEMLRIFSIIDKMPMRRLEMLSS